ncbi:MAG: c-type cytochrome [Rhodocyclaceae bacterium]|nr:cytochrome c [Rhodocyclaceae bacterium]MCB1901467.1 cytochrome c [Rhodocyclaceae bacterium]MCP5308151.1 cytochrome c [Zoogloeaceae bacterium]
MVLLAATLAGCSGESASPGAADAATLVLGEALYAKHCASCHGAGREGQTEWRSRKPDGRLPAPPHDETGHTWHHPMAQLFAMTKFGLVPPLAPEGYQSDMPAFAGILSDDEIRAVLAWIESAWPEEVRRMRAERFAQNR